MYHSGAANTEDAALNTAPERSPRPCVRSVSAATPPESEAAPPANALISELYTAKLSTSPGKRERTAGGNHTKMAKPAQKRNAEASNNHLAEAEEIASVLLVTTSRTTPIASLLASEVLEALAVSPRVGR
eukprot:CAMPEP_0171086876 /NCGR_PEP_ID=MMETSP0766_2-20121228/19811_1 /TAXON_ID=439317 /ORGANISM="Gambierdiscus australes, Strain CAWD 149" /LENGTH=129 /DNA_ID=CAMNT_0011544549 /DNA_START=271 /DNA_END=657 /DNA_ORIENTATION=-